MNTGDRVQIIEGATKWMKDNGYWHEEFGDSIDGYLGEIVNNYTCLSGNDAHYGINIGFDFIVGVNPMWLKLN